MSGPQYHRTRHQDQHLVGYECQSCGWISFPQNRAICKQCGDAPASFEPVQLAEQGVVRSFVIQEYLPDEFEVPQSIAIIDVPKADESDGYARVYGLLTEIERSDLSVGAEVDARFRALFGEGERPIHSFKFAVPQEDRL